MNDEDTFDSEEDRLYFLGLYDGIFRYGHVEHESELNQASETGLAAEIEESKEAAINGEWEFPSPE